jgi:hypothetical protein
MAPVQATRNTIAATARGGSYAIAQARTMAAVAVIAIA